MSLRTQRYDLHTNIYFSATDVQASKILRSRHKLTRYRENTYSHFTDTSRTLHRHTHTNLTDSTLQRTVSHKSHALTHASWKHSMSKDSVDESDNVDVNREIQRVAEVNIGPESLRTRGHRLLPSSFSSSSSRRKSRIQFQWGTRWLYLNEAEGWLLQMGTAYHRVL